LAYDGNELTLNVRDDGRGPPAVDFDTLADGRMGLAGMRERALALGGSVELEAQEGTGTLLRIRIPVTDLNHDSGSDRGGKPGGVDQQEPIR
jgi:signal transduction histidine kinase